MNESQEKQIQDLVQEVAEISGTDFDAAFERVLGIAKYHAIDCIPKGEGRAGDSAQSAYSHADQPSA